MNNPLFPLLALLANHLWQSTLFALVIAGAALLLRANSARVRYVLWLAASLKFLVPFAFLAALGTLIPWHPPVGEQGAAPGILAVVGDFTAPISGSMVYPMPLARTGNTAAGHGIAVGSLVAIVALVVWALGLVLVAGRRLLLWFEIRRALLASVLLTGIEFPAPVRATARQFEPGVVGIIRPVLLLPQGMQ